MSDATNPGEMRAVAIDGYGGVETLTVRTLPVPTVEAGEVRVRLSHAGVAVWDPFEREGGFAELAQQMYGKPQTFPLVIGSDGAGEVVEVGAGVEHVSVGDKVYVAAFINPKGGVYAQQVVAKAEAVAPVPAGLTAVQAATFGGDAGTALRGLDDVLKLKDGESLAVLGAGGGLGHFAVQLAKRRGARVLAIASGADGKALATKIGADTAVDGRNEDIAAAAAAFAPGGLDAALLTTGGEVGQTVLGCVRQGGRAAYPHGVMPEPTAPDGVSLHAFNGDVDAELLARLNQLVEAEPGFHVEIAETFPLDKAADAHRKLDEHYLGKLALVIG